jgi:dTDP-4-amino-4,6-dideoxygalactose transaminase
MASILELAKRYGLKIIEDCAQSLGVEYGGKKVGSLGDAGCLSFFPSKVLGSYGDGGLVVTDKPEIAENLIMLRNHGRKEKYFYLVHGFNSRLDALQAAILRVKLKYIDEWIKARREKASLYMRLLDGIEGIKLPFTPEGDSPIFYCFTIRLTDKKRDRDGFIRHLSSNGIATAVYYPLSLHLQPVYEYLNYKVGDLPVSEKAQEEVLSLPIYPELSEEQIKYIVDSILAYK